MTRNHLLSLGLLLLLGGAPLSATLAQAGVMRGEAEIQAAQRSVEMGLIVEEMEEAGFVLDVEEGFDEEWEEAVWLDTDAQIGQR
jgi:hypothetical protein